MGFVLENFLDGKPNWVIENLSSGEGLMWEGGYVLERGRRVVLSGKNLVV
jgi:hypothetical protein